MHGLNQIAHLNQVAIQEYRERAQKALDADEAEPTYTIADIEAAREEGQEEGSEAHYDAGSEAGYDTGYMEGFEMGRNEAAEELNGTGPLLDHLTKWGIEPSEPFTAVYDAAIKALVFHQGDFTVVLNNGLSNS